MSAGRFVAVDVAGAPRPARKRHAMKRADYEAKRDGKRFEIDGHYAGPWVTFCGREARIVGLSYDGVSFTDPVDTPPSRRCPECNAQTQRLDVIAENEAHDALREVAP